MARGNGCGTGHRPRRDTPARRCASLTAAGHPARDLARASVVRRHVATRPLRHAQKLGRERSGIRTPPISPDHRHAARDAIGVPPEADGAKPGRGRPSTRAGCRPRRESASGAVGHTGPVTATPALGFGAPPLGGRRRGLSTTARPVTGLGKAGVMGGTSPRSGKGRRECPGQSGSSFRTIRSGRGPVGFGKEHVIADRRRAMGEKPVGQRGHVAARPGPIARKGRARPRRCR